MSDFPARTSTIIYICLLFSLLFHVLPANAYYWSPAPAYCTDTALVGVFSTTPKLYVTLPNGTRMEITNIVTGTQVLETDYICEKSTAITGYLVEQVDELDSPIHFSIKDVCQSGTNGIEGNYDFSFYAHRDSYCTLNDLPVEWNDDDSWCINPKCGKGDYLPSVQRTRRCCSAREMDSQFRYTNEDCNMLELTGTELCYITDNHQGSLARIAAVDALWLNASALVGEIIYEGCGDNPATSSVEEGYEYLSFDSRIGGIFGVGGTILPTWSKCTASGFINSAGDRIGRFITINKVSPNDQSVNLTHDYACIDWLAPRRYSIAECIGHDGAVLNSADTYDGALGGIVADGGQSVNLSDRKVYYCTDKNTWSEDLDNYELVGEDGEFCRRAALPKIAYKKGNNVDDGVLLNASWTGKYCCGELDDFSGIYPANLAFATTNEYYNDDDRLSGHYSQQSNGACFNSWPQANKSFIEIKEAANRIRTKQLKEVMVWHGTFQGCAIDSNLALQMKSDASVNEGKVSEQLTCAIPNNRNKPYGGTFRTGIVPATYGFIATGTDGNDFLSALKHNPNSNANGAGDQLIHDNEYCNIKWDGPGSKKYYCSYNETWKEDTTDDQNNRSHLSFVAWNENDPRRMQAECCTPTQCWNGTVCIESVEITNELSKPHKIMNTFGDGFICKNGHWDWSYNKTTWDGAENGYCPKNDQCLVDPSGDRTATNVYRPTRYAIDEIGSVERPACINSGEYYEDHFCENGTWTSRTKYAALALYNAMKNTGSIGPKNNYTLHCDTYDHVLNSYTYPIQALPENIEETFFQPNPSSKCFTYAGEVVPCVNHVCVLSASGVGNTKFVLFAAPINHRLNKSIASIPGVLEYIADFGEALGNRLSNCNQIPNAGFVSCGGDVFFSHELGIVLYAQGINIPTTPTLTNYKSALSYIFTSFLKTIVDRIISDPTLRGITSGFKYDEIITMSEDLMKQADPSYSINRTDFECNNCADNNNNGQVRDEVCNILGNPRKQLDLSTLYLSEAEGKTIFGLSELEAYPYLVGSTRNPNRFHAAVFQGFDYNICSRFSSPLGPGEGVWTPGYTCISDIPNKKYYIFSKLDQTNTGFDTSFNTIVDILASEQWRFLTVATRTK